MRALWLWAALLLPLSTSASYWQGQPLTNEWQQYLAVSAKLLAQDAAALADAVATASAILVCAPPLADGCPGLKALSPALAATDVWPDWIGYVSSTAVYGDRGGGWALEDSELNAASLEGATPFMAQYLTAKAGQPDAILFFRMGDFYELFFKDAEIASAALGITLTKRGKHQGQDIPMAGVPVHALDGYLARLIRQGFKAAICEQLEDPKSVKGIVKRGVTEVVTPGIAHHDTLLSARSNNFLAALHTEGQQPRGAAQRVFHRQRAGQVPAPRRCIQGSQRV